MKTTGPSDRLVYLGVAAGFFIPLGLFVFCLIKFFPSRIAAMVLGLSGFTVIVAGPFWAMQLEKTLRDALTKKNGAETSPD